ncbi:MAG TPA: hypothetical protein VFR23_07920 [Jiangellaceae bacterium]|nr:hypothetical protein [Jiangellaceae bacterium]
MARWSRTGGCCPYFDEDVLRFEPDKAERSTRVVVGIDSEALAHVWITAVETAQPRPQDTGLVTAPAPDRHPNMPR